MIVARTAKYQSVSRSREVMRELILAPEAIELSTDIRPELRKRSIYEAVVYDARMTGKARFAFPPDLSRTGVAASDMDLTRAELRYAGIGAGGQTLSRERRAEILETINLFDQNRARA